jgi:tetratricopeptide (TPR) repeat protein
VRAQDVTVQMQRALYLEQTAGDLDGAIQIYREILTHGADAAYEAEAQFRLGTCLLKTGNKAMAARTFQQLIQMHPEAAKLVAQATTHFVDSDVGYSFTVPLGWSVTSRPPRQGPGSCAELEDPEGQGFDVTICAKPEAISRGNIDARMAKGEANYLQDQLTRFPDFTLRSSPVAGTLAGQHTLTLIADYTSGSRRLTAWTTWVESEATRSSIAVRVPRPQLAEFRARFMPILNSYRVR